jgi:acylphosphatase
MKHKITITGPKVHDVGYRYLLLGGAMGLRLPGFYATNLVELEKQIVEVLVEGKEPQVKAFIEFVQNNKPANARVSDITTSEYEDDVPRRREYTQDITALQMLKTIPTILKIEENTKLIPQIAKNTDLIPQIAKNTELIPQMANNTERILEEVKGLREDIQPGYAIQFRQMQADIRAIKERLGMP